ncbi:MAG: trypsin-like peptidase domain-containing protein [Pirellulaceae bacterium]|nr:trypsin-like peptidase domain-containing protein [Pirellulaceae bacterium]
MRLRGFFQDAFFISIATVLTLRSYGLADEVPEAVIKAEQNRIQTIDQAMRTAVAVFGPGSRGGGSGVVISPDGYALSNFHVTHPSGDYMKCSMADGKLYDAVIVGVDPTGDVALIKLLGREDFPYTPLGDSDKVLVGDWCFVVGNPFLLATDFQPTVTYGIVSGVHRYQYPSGTLLEYADCLQTDASINPGNSGGPLFDAQGSLIGINGRGSFEKRGRVNVGVGYAISANQIKHFLGYLHSGRIVDHATLGATVATAPDGRVIVSNVVESADAYRRGLRYGDELIEFGGRPVDTVNQFKNVLGIYPKGWRIPLSFRRGNQRFDVLVRLAGLHAQDELLEKVSGHSLEPPRPKPPEPPEKKKRPQDKPKPQPPLPHKPAIKADLPPEIAKIIVKKRGYANYYFNELNRQRVWEAFRTTGNFSKQNGPWSLIGKMDAEGEVRVTLENDRVLADFPRGPETMKLDDPLEKQLAPRGSGGLLISMYLWRQLLISGPATYGDVFYLGQAPVFTHQELCDVFQTTHDAFEAKYFFHPNDGTLVAMEMYPDTNMDPCELYFHDYRNVKGTLLPHRLEVRIGDTAFGTLEIQSFELNSAAAENDPA